MTQPSPTTLIVESTAAVDCPIDFLGDSADIEVIRDHGSRTIRVTFPEREDGGEFAMGELLGPMRELQRSLRESWLESREQIRESVGEARQLQRTAMREAREALREARRLRIQNSLTQI